MDTTTQDNASSGRDTLRTLRNMPDWLVIALVILLALLILGLSLMV